MANPQNLKPVKLDTSPEKQRERGKKRTLAKALINRKYCDNSCPIYPCSLAPIALSNAKKGEKPLCVLKNMPAKLKQQYLNIYSGDKKNLMQEIQNTLSDIAQDVILIAQQGDIGKSLNYKQKYLESLLKVARTIEKQEENE